MLKIARLPRIPAEIDEKNRDPGGVGTAQAQGAAKLEYSGYARKFSDAVSWSRPFLPSSRSWFRRVLQHRSALSADDSVRPGAPTNRPAMLHARPPQAAASCVYRTTRRERPPGYRRPSCCPDLPGNPASTTRACSLRAAVAHPASDDRRTAFPRRYGGRLKPNTIRSVCCPRPPIVRIHHVLEDGGRPAHCVGSPLRRTRPASRLSNRRHHLPAGNH